MRTSGDATGEDANNDHGCLSRVIRLSDTIKGHKQVVLFAQGIVVEPKRGQRANMNTVMIKLQVVCLFPPFGVYTLPNARKAVKNGEE